MVLMDSAKRSSLSADRRDNYYRGLFIRTDNQNETIISLAVMTNNLDLVKLILKESPEYEDPYSIKYSDLKSVISTASREGYKDIFEILCEKYEAGDDDHSCYVLLTEAIKEGKKGTRYLFTFPVIKYFAVHSLRLRESSFAQSD